LIGLAGVLAAGACFAGFPLEQGVGISIGLGSAVFVAIGVQIMLKSQQDMR
jgi:preprotein translocase subunit SecF